MANLFTYLKNSQFESFYDRPLCTLDIVALTELAYLPFDDLVCYDFSPENSIRIDQLAQDFKEKFKDGYPPLSMADKDHLELLDQLAGSKRFKHIKAFGYVNDIDLEAQKQFAAMCFKISRDNYVIIFRGTDDTLIAWKEDFHMTYMAEIPAQKSASKYLEKLMAHLDGTFHIAGHSKGGNLAVYAASQQTSSNQKRIQAIYGFDAPGVHKSVLESSGFLAIEEKIQTFIPDNSIVGMMLETPKGARVVNSKSFGLLQHIVFTWEVEGNDFKEVKSVSSDSLQVDKTLKSWTASLSDDELKQFFDLFFGLFIEAGIYRFSDITINTLDKIQKVIANSQNMLAEEKEMLNRATRLLVDTRFKVWKDSLPNLSDVKEGISNLVSKITDTDDKQKEL